MLVQQAHRLSTRLAPDKASGSDLLFWDSRMSSCVLLRKETRQRHIDSNHRHIGAPPQINSKAIPAMSPCSKLFTQIISEEQNANSKPRVTSDAQSRQEVLAGTRHIRHI